MSAPWRERSRSGRPPGIAPLSLLITASGIGGIVSPVWSQAPTRLDMPTDVRALIVAASVVAMGVGVAIWRMHPWARRAYLAWAALNLASVARYGVTVLSRDFSVLARQLLPGVELPAVSPGVVGVALVLHASFLALGYWYLRAQWPRESVEPAT